MAAFDVARPDGIALRGFVDGDGPDVLLVSGLGGTAAFWDPVVACLSGRFRLIRFDQRGIAASPRGAAPCTIATLAEDAAAVLDAAGASCVTLVGHSTGGCIVQEMALTDPSGVAGLVLSGAWGRRNRYMAELFRSRLWLLDQDPRQYAALSAFTSYTPDWLDRNWARYEAIVAAAPVSPDAKAVVAERIAALLAFDRSAELAALARPAAIMGAADDLIVPAFLQRDLARTLPRAPIEILPEGGHFFPVTQAERVSALLSGWMTGFLS